MNYWLKIGLMFFVVGAVVAILGILIWDLHGWRLTLLSLAVGAPLVWRFSRPDPKP